MSASAKKRVVVKTPKKTVTLAYPCTNCGGDAYVAYTGPGWGGLIKKDERLCLPCGKRRGVKFF